MYGMPYYINNWDIHKAANAAILSFYIQEMFKMLDSTSRHPNELCHNMADLDKERSWHVYSSPR